MHARTQGDGSHMAAASGSQWRDACNTAHSQIGEHLEADVLHAVDHGHRLCSGTVEELDADGCPALRLEHIACQVLVGEVAVAAPVGVLFAQVAVCVQAPQVPVGNNSISTMQKATLQAPVQAWCKACSAGPHCAVRAARYGLALASNELAVIKRQAVHGQLHSQTWCNKCSTGTTL